MTMGSDDKKEKELEDRLLKMEEQLIKQNETLISKVESKSAALVKSE